MGFVRRLLKATFVLGEGDFGTQGSNQMDIADLRMSAKIANAGGRSMGTAQVMIYGMTLEQMNRLSTLGLVATAIRKNSLTLAAGDEGKPLAVVFQGTINNAWADFSSAPSVPFHVIAQTGLFTAVQPVVPISINGSTNVSELLSGVATQMGVAFNNNGVTAKLSSGYYDGTPTKIAQDIVDAAGIGWNAGEKGTMEIWPAGGSKQGAAVLLSKTTGMDGYPSWTPNGIMVKTLYNPSIGLGSKIDIQSILKEATGQWIVYKLDHDLDSLVPGGKWVSTILGHRLGDGPFVS